MSGYSRVCILTLVVYLAGGSCAFADSLWNHNGSIMRLTAEGDHRQFLYENPKPLLRDAGVKEGTVLFEGNRIGDKYTGTARRFTKNCTSPLPYEVSGNVRNETVIVLQGRREVYDDNCHHDTTEWSEVAA